MQLSVTSSVVLSVLCIAVILVSVIAENHDCPRKSSTCTVTADKDQTAYTKKCKFPFKDDSGQLYFGCIDDDPSGKPPWCAWSMNEDLSYKGWGNCNMSVPECNETQGTNPNVNFCQINPNAEDCIGWPRANCHADIAGNQEFTKNCIFPVRYKDQVYDRCITVDSSKNNETNRKYSWCYWEVDDLGVGVRGKWGDCNPNEPACQIPHNCTDDGHTTMAPGSEKDLGDNSDDDESTDMFGKDNPEDSEMDNTAKTPNNANNNDKSPQDDTEGGDKKVVPEIKENPNAKGCVGQAVPDCKCDDQGKGTFTKQCIFPFIFEGKTYDKCLLDPATQKYWCYYTVHPFTGVGEQGKWGDCDMTQAHCSTTHDCPKCAVPEVARLIVTVQFFDWFDVDTLNLGNYVTALAREMGLPSNAITNPMKVNKTLQFTFKEVDDNLGKNCTIDPEDMIEIMKTKIKKSDFIAPELAGMRKVTGEDGTTPTEYVGKVVKKAGGLKNIALAIAAFALLLCICAKLRAKTEAPFERLQNNGGGMELSEVSPATDALNMDLDAGSEDETD